MLPGYTLDSLKLLLSDDYEMSDREYKALSDILSKNKVSSVAVDNGILNIVSLLDRKGMKFPISLSRLKELWRSENIEFNFVSMLGELVKEGYVKMKRVSEPVFFDQTFIDKGQADEPGQGSYVVVYGSEKLNTLLEDFRSVVYSKVQKAQKVSESGGHSLPPYANSVITLANKYLEHRANAYVEVEAFSVYDDLNNTLLNLLIKNLGNYTIRNSEITRMARKYFKSQLVEGLEVVKEDHSLFVSFYLYAGGTAGEYRKIAEAFGDFIEELEIEGGSKP